jgi:hypothetical protein
MMTRPLLLSLVLAACSKNGDAPKTQPATRPDAGRPADAAAKAPDPDPIPVVVTNRRDQTVFIETAGSCDDAPVTMTGPDGPIRWTVQGDSCDAVRAGQCRTFGDCAGPFKIEIAAGASHEVSWNGLHVVERKLKPGEGCSTLCYDWIPAPAGTYEVQVDVWTTCKSKNDCPVKSDLIVKQPVELPATRIELEIK